MKYFLLFLFSLFFTFLSSNADESLTSGTVMYIDSDNFQQEIVEKSKPDDVWLLEFYAPWCGHCQRFESTYDQVAKDLKGQVKVGKVDATSNKLLALQFGVNGYPTIFHIKGQEVRKYKGARTLDSVKSFALQGYTSARPMGYFTNPLSGFGRFKVSFVLFFEQIADFHDGVSKNYNIHPLFVAVGMMFTTVIVLTAIIIVLIYLCTRQRSTGHLHNE